MPTFYQTALDQLVPDLARTLRAVAPPHGLSRPAISVVRACPGYDRDMLLRDALTIAGARAHLSVPIAAWVVRADASLDGLSRAVQRMLTTQDNALPPLRVLVVPGLMDQPEAERRAWLDRLHDLDEAPWPCHVLTTQDPSTRVDMDWNGRLLRVEVDLTPRPELSAVLLAREAMVPGRSPLVRRLFHKQWDALRLISPDANVVYAEALGEFAAEALAQDPWPWSSHEDDPARRLALAALLLPAAQVRPVLQTLVARLANHPLMSDRIVNANTWDDPQLTDDVRDALLTLLRRPSCIWGPERQSLAAEVLRARAIPPTEQGLVIQAEWTVVDDPTAETFFTHPASINPLTDAQAQPAPKASWWERLANWCRSPFRRPSSRALELNRGDALVWTALNHLDGPEAAQRWVPVSLTVARTCLRWPDDEARVTLNTLINGLAALPGLWPDDHDGWAVQRWSMTARHALLTALDTLPGWTDRHHQMLVEALTPIDNDLELYTIDGRSPTGRGRSSVRVGLV